MTDAPALRDIPFTDASGDARTLASYGDGVVLVVNVASKCGLTPQYGALEELQRTYGERGLTVVGFPCNQFMGQEPGGMDEILDYCATTWGVSFPINDKIRVNGSHAAPLYKALKKNKDGLGLAGPVAWNFEKFVVLPDGSVRRFRPNVTPDDPAITALIEEHLPR
ncbi:glutathione peroxidase [Microbacterium excoecariae]|uniref:glutathione peroxidase n=1 Tax=Microbacterium excoecariae TaxID=2715210 RepID=UPI0014085665|nr:glutathione peroxidase [Microbacterium excoecariae]NHI17043.1 glutathione peroxidase [Microbacterium excoecariae]